VGCTIFPKISPRTCTADERRKKASAAIRRPIAEPWLFRENRPAPGTPPQGTAFRPISLKGVFLVGRLDRAAPRTPEPVQHLLGRRTAAIDDPVERLQVAGLVPSGVVDPGAAPQARMGQREAFLGDLEQIAVLIRALKPKRGTSSRSAWRSGAFQPLARSQAASRLTLS